MSYEVYVWDLSNENPVLVERKNFTRLFDACDYQDIMEDKGYECHFSDNETLKCLYN